MNKPAASNPFDALSDDPILHIMSYLPGADVLNVMGTNREFRRIIGETAQTSRKIPLVLNFNEQLDLDDARQFVQTQTRCLTKLRLNEVYNLENDEKIKFGILLGMLNSSVDNITISGRMTQDVLLAILAMPTLKRLSLEFAELDDIDDLTGIGPQNRNLDTVQFNQGHVWRAFRFFTRCDRLKTILYENYNIFARCGSFNDFLATQTHLEKLTFRSIGIEWDRLVCYRLKELTVTCSIERNEDEAGDFLKKLLDLQKLSITIGNRPSRSIIEAICQRPKLEMLAIKLHGGIIEDEDEERDSLEGLRNDSVKHLILDVSHESITSQLLRIFIGTTRISLQVGFSVLNLSNVSYQTIMKMEPHEDDGYYFKIKFSPSDPPADIENFQFALMKFANKFSCSITGVEIGHENWLNNGSFTLPNSFCEELINQLPELRKLKLFNIADRGKLLTWLGENEARLKLENIKLQKPLATDEPHLKKMKIY